MENIVGGLSAILVFMALSTPVIIICIVYYFKKKLDHKEILAAIEKGMPLSELKPTKSKTDSDSNWVRNITKGIICLIIGLGLVPLICFLIEENPDRVFAIFWIMPLVFLANGIGQVVAGVLNKKNEKNDNDTAEQPSLP